jgi:UDP-N-acetylglucosamine 2-epimerase
VTRRTKILTVFGTRPEAIKLAPVIEALRKRDETFESLVCCTGQHREMVDQVIEAFGIGVDIRFDAMSAAQSLGQLTGRLFGEMDRIVSDTAPDWVLVQGDTTSAMVAATCAFYRRAAVGHVEAGLRTYNRWAPFPEEVNREFITRVTDQHFAPTERAARLLKQELVDPASIHVTGNTVVDALLQVKPKLGSYRPPDLAADVLNLFDAHKVILVTSHRRESFGAGLEQICQAIVDIVHAHPQVAVVYPVHLNPNVRKPVHRILGDHPRIRLVEPVAYMSLLLLMQRCHLVLTDSGGLQEEAPSFGKPLLVLRETTERPEAVENGCARLVGTSRQGIVSAANELLTNASAYESMVARVNPFGDGKAGRRIVDILAAAPSPRTA